MLQYAKNHMTQFLMGILAVVIGVQLVQTWQLYAEDPLTVTYSGEPEEVFILKAGDEFVFKRDVCVYQDLDVTVHREFHNLETGDKHMLSGIRYVAYAEDGCYTTEFATDVPERIKRGVYEYRPILIYDVNSNLTIAKPAPTVTVEVIE